jgi:hypothetical protein
MLQIQQCADIGTPTDLTIKNTPTVPDPRVNDWPLMDSPLPTMIIVAVYLYLVVVLGPRLMANRKPFQLNAVLVVYNALQVIFSVVMLWEVRRRNTVDGPYPGRSVTA